MSKYAHPRRKPVRPWRESDETGSVSRHQGARGKLDEHILEWLPCSKCAISGLTTNKVFYRIAGQIDRVKGSFSTHNHTTVVNSDSNVEYLFVGEAPSELECTSGVPFSGSNNLLVSLAKSSGITRYAFMNLLACKPVDSDGSIRGATICELQNCKSRVVEAYKIFNPIGLVVLGYKVAQEWLASYPVPNVKAVAILPTIDEMKDEYSARYSLASFSLSKYVELVEKHYNGKLTQQ